MKILVVGAQGQVARELARLLPATGHEFRVAGRPEIDLAQPDSVCRVVGDYEPDAIINAAAYTSVDKAEDEPAVADAVNGHGVGILGRAAAGVPVIHFSTDYVFDGAQDGPYAETDEPRPAGAYGASKLLGERKLLEANPRSVILRTSWVCSPFGHNFVKTMLRLARERGEVSVVHDQIGAPTFAGDLAALAIALPPRLAPRPAGDEGFGIFHYAGAPNTSWHDFAFMIFALAAQRGQRPPLLHAIRSEQFPTRARRPGNSQLNCAKIARIHGVERPDWELGLRDTLERLEG